MAVALTPERLPPVKDVSVVLDTGDTEADIAALWDDGSITGLLRESSALVMV